MVNSTYKATLFKMVTLALICFVLLAACDLEKQSASLCEKHFLAKSHKIALKHCKDAAESGDVASQYYLGMMQIQAGNNEEGHRLIHAAAEVGFHKALFHRVVERILNPSDEKDAADAVRQMQQYAEAGDDVAQFWMGSIFLFGHAKQEKSPNEAVYWYELSVQQNNLKAMNNLAWVKAIARDSELFDAERALQLAIKVTNAYPQSHGYLDTLAAAYAANGRFQEAVDIQQKALNIANSKECEGCSERLIKYYQKHLQLYQQQKPLKEDLLK